MPFPALSAVVATAARSAGTSPNGAATDGELLREFVRTQDEGAFADLVRRVGPMVLGVCRRVAGDPHLAEDAFQATFVVLARRARDVRPAEAVRAWLYGVAVRTAREARSVSLRRLAREAPVAAIPDRPGEPVHESDGDALRVLDEEVAALPDHLRAAVILCELEGASRQQASKRLGIVEGTLSSRLAKARKVLAARLRKRGVTLPAAGLAVLASSATVSARLTAQTSALLSSTAPLPPAVAALSNGVFRAMFLQKLTLGVACGLVLVAAGFVAAGSLPDATTPAPSRPRALVVVEDRSRPEGKPQRLARASGGGSILVIRDDGPLWLASPDGKKKTEERIPEKARRADDARISPDRKRVALIVNTEEDVRPAPRSMDEIKPWPFKVLVRPIDKPDEEKSWDISANYLSVCWMADGKKLVASRLTNPHWTECECLVLDPQTGGTEKLDIPANARVLDCGKDGKTFLVQSYDAKAKKCQLGLVKLGEKEVTVLCDLHDRGNRPTDARLSPDGKRVLLIDADPERKDAQKWGCSQRVYLLDIRTKKREPLADFPENGRAAGIAWSPDGKKLAYTWAPLDEELLKRDQIISAGDAEGTEGFLMVADADGKNAKTIASEKGRFSLGYVLRSIDWR